MVSSEAQLLTILGAKSLDLAWCVDEFKRICRGWDKYNEELNTLSVIHTRKYVSPFLIGIVRMANFDSFSS